jgi:hypothetical protein
LDRDLRVRLIVEEVQLDRAAFDAAGLVLDLDELVEGLRLRLPEERAAAGEIRPSVQATAATSASAAVLRGINVSPLS